MGCVSVRVVMVVGGVVVKGGLNLWCVQKWRSRQRDEGWLG